MAGPTFEQPMLSQHGRSAQPNWVPSRIYEHIVDVRVLVHLHHMIYDALFAYFKSFLKRITIIETTLLK